MDSKIKSPGFPGDFLNALVFLPGGKTAPDVALTFIFIQNRPDLPVEGEIHPLYPLGQVFVDGGFGNAEVSGGGAHGGSGFYDVHSHFAGSLLDGV